MIALGGEHAGDWIDFDDQQGGGPLNTLEHATGLTGRALIEYAAELAGSAPVNGAKHPIAERARQGAAGREHRAGDRADPGARGAARGHRWRDLPRRPRAANSRHARPPVPPGPDLLGHPHRLPGADRDRARCRGRAHRHPSHLPGARRLGQGGGPEVAHDAGLGRGRRRAAGRDQRERRGRPRRGPRDLPQRDPGLPRSPRLGGARLGQPGAGRAAARGCPGRHPRRQRWRGRRAQGRAARRREVRRRRPAGLDRPPTRCRRGFQRSAAERGIGRSPRGGRGGCRVATRVAAARIGGRSRLPDRDPSADRVPATEPATAPDARRCRRPCSTHRPLLEPAVRRQCAALALPLRRRARLGRARQRWSPGAAADDRGPRAPRPGAARRLAPHGEERRPGADRAAGAAAQEPVGHARSRPAGPDRHRHRAGVRQGRHADHRARLSPRRPAAVRAEPGLRAAGHPRAPDARRHRLQRAPCCSTTCSATSRSSARPSARTRWRFCSCPSCGR